MNAQLQQIDPTDKELIFEAMQILSGESKKLATKDHIRALLGERTNIIAVLGVAHDGLVDASEALYGNQQSMAKAILADTKAALLESDFLGKDWVERVLRG